MKPTNQFFASAIALSLVVISGCFGEQDAEKLEDSPLSSEEIEIRREEEANPHRALAESIKAKAEAGSKSKTTKD